MFPSDIDCYFGVGWKHSTPQEYPLPFYKDFAPLVLEKALKKGCFSQILSFAKFSR
jgi:hypothetical protein